MAFLLFIFYGCILKSITGVIIMNKKMILGISSVTLLAVGACAGLAV